jgi:hypothetical protein
MQSEPAPISKKMLRAGNIANALTGLLLLFGADRNTLGLEDRFA